MFSLKGVEKELTLEEIYDSIGQYNLWKYYCKNFQKVDSSFKSELYNDKNPSCRIRCNKRGNLVYRDFGGDNKDYSVIDYIMFKYNCTFKESLNIILSDFGLSVSNLHINREMKDLKFEEKLLTIVKRKIEIVSQPFTIADYDYWNQYSIPLTLLNTYNVFSCKHVYIYKNDDVFVLNYNKLNPLYAYRFYNKSGYNHKIYKPLEKNKAYKWLTTGSSIEGYKQLDKSSNILILTKSLKDCIVYRLLGYNAISLQSETTNLDESIVNELLSRFKTIIVNYDNDEEGIKNTLKIANVYNFKYFYIPKYKDVSDYIKSMGLSSTKRMINNQIKKTNDKQ